MLGQNAGSNGTITVDGAHSLLSPFGAGSSPNLSLTVGGAGQGSLSVTGGAVAEIGDKIIVGRDLNSTGSLTVDGTGSSLTSAGYGGEDITSVTVGASGSGTLSVTGGGLANASSPVTIGQDATATGSATVSGALSQFSMTSLTVGQSGSGSLQGTAGGVIKASGAAVIAQNSNSQGSLSLDASQLSMTSLTVGQAGNGTFSAIHGSVATSSGAATIAQSTGSQGSVTVDGSGSQLSFTSLTVGQSGTGSMDLTGGGNGIDTGGITLGTNQGSSGSVMIDGGNLQLNNTNGTPFTVGQSGTGQVSLTGGGSVVGQFTPMLIGANAGSNGSVSVSGSNTNLILNGADHSRNGTILVGQNGTGMLAASGGANLYARSINVGYTTSNSTPTGSGQLTLDGAGTTMTLSAGNVVVGHQTSGTVSVTNGAKVSGISLTIGDRTNGSGSVTIDGAHSLWTNTSGAIVGSGAGIGSLTISNGGQLIAPSMNTGLGSSIDIEGGTLTLGTYGELFNFANVTNNGTLDGYIDSVFGILSGSGNITGVLTVDGGILSPGNSPGAMTVGALTMRGGDFRFEINSAEGTAGNALGWNLLNVEGSATVTQNITLDLVSLSQANAAGSLFDFDPFQNYQWTFISGPQGLSFANARNSWSTPRGLPTPTAGTSS